MQLIEIITVTSITTVITLLSNILYFYFKSRKEDEKKLLEKQLKEFLLPLYIIFIEDDLLWSEYANHPDLDHTDYMLERSPRILKNAKSLILKKRQPVCFRQTHHRAYSSQFH